MTKKRIIKKNNFTLKEVPKKSISNGLLAVADINKGQKRYSLPLEKDRKVIAVYQLVKRFK
jgi:hypothetical protein